MFELKPLVGYMDGQAITHDVNMLFYEGKHIGIVGTTPGSPVNLTQHVSPEFAKEAYEWVKNHTGVPPLGESAAYPPSQEQLEAALNHNQDDEDDE